MKASAEISLYPLDENYKERIIDFIHRLKSDKSVEIVTNGMSTQVFGEYDEVMEAITSEIKKSFEIPHSVFVLKVINADLDIK